MKNKEIKKGTKYFKDHAPLRGFCKSSLTKILDKDELLNPEEIHQFNSLCDGFDIHSLSEADRSLVILACLNLVKIVRFEKEMFSAEKNFKSNAEMKRELAACYDVVFKSLKLSGLTGETRQAADSQQ